MKIALKMKKWQVLLSLHKMFLDNNYFFSNNDQNNTQRAINTHRAKSARHYPESQKRQTLPGEPKAPDNTRRAKSDQTIPGEPKAARQYPESQKCQTIPGQPIAPDNTRRAKSTRQFFSDNTRIANYFFFQNCFENKKVASITQFT